MKKYLIIFLMAVLCCGAVCGCCFIRNSDGGETDGASDAQSTYTASDKTAPQINIPPSSDVYTYEYDSYADVNRALTISSSYEYMLLRDKAEKYGSLYKNTLERFGDGDEVLYVPEINGEPVELRGIEGYSGVSLLTCELYYLPWIWYHCIFDGADIDIKISYPGALESAEIESTKTYLDVIKLIAPDAPSPSNYRQYENYKSIYEKDVALSDGQAVTVMISEMRDNSKIYAMMLLNGTLITMHGEAEIFSDEFWRSFGLAEYDGV